LPAVFFADHNVGYVQQYKYFMLMFSPVAVTSLTFSPSDVISSRQCSMLSTYASVITEQ